MSDNRKDDLRISGSIVIETERFVLRPLTEADVSERYLQWFADQDALIVKTIRISWNYLLIKSFAKEKLWVGGSKSMCSLASSLRLSLPLLLSPQLFGASGIRVG